jgi:hypothetical protein
MSRRWCIVLRPTEDATSEDVEAIARAFRKWKRRLDYEREGDDFSVFVDSGQSLGRARYSLRRMLTKSGLEHAVIRPFWVGRWASDEEGWVFPAWKGEPPAPPEPAVPPDDIGWGVVVRPPSAFEWRMLRDALAARGRVVVAEADRTIEVGARDEADALALLADLRAGSLIADDSRAHAYGRFRRWRIRHAMLGGYGSA